MADAKILEFIFLENPHQELIKRAGDLISAISLGQALTHEHIALVWSCCRSDKHEDVIRATYALLTELSATLPLEFLGLIFMRI